MLGVKFRYLLLVMRQSVLIVDEVEEFESEDYDNSGKLSGCIKIAFQADTSNTEAANSSGSEAPHNSIVHALFNIEFLFQAYDHSEVVIQGLQYELSAPLEVKEAGRRKGRGVLGRICHTGHPKGVIRL